MGGFRFVPGREFTGNVHIVQFPGNFTLLNHAGFSGLLFTAIWFWWYWKLWTPYNILTFVIVMVLFCLMTWLAPQFANNISSNKLMFTNVADDFDWLYYARHRMTLLLLIFCFNCSFLIWASGGLSSPFIPFYVMVYTLALNYCRFPWPAAGLTLAFIGFFLIAMVFSELPWVRLLVPAPIDAKTQIAIDGLYARKVFEASFVSASMLAPLISMWLAAKMAGVSALPAAAETVALQRTGDDVQGTTTLSDASSPQSLSS